MSLSYFLWLPRTSTTRHEGCTSVSQSVTSCEDTPHSGTDFETQRQTRRLQVLTIDSTLDTLYPDRTQSSRRESPL